MMRRSALSLFVVACRPTTTVAEPKPSETVQPEAPSSEPAATLAVMPEPTPSRFAAFDRAPAGLDAAGIREYARSQGDPLGGSFSLAAALIGDTALERGTGKLVATLRTNKGAIECELFETKAPLTVANFVGLARGTRPFRDPNTKSWKTGRFYDSTTFHRVIAGFVIQGGDRLGNGSGEIGYVIADEVDPQFVFDTPGVLAMANSGMNTGNSQFFITLAAMPHLNGSQVAFGRCDPKVPLAIAEVPIDRTTGDRPIEPVTIERIDVTRR